MAGSVRLQARGAVRGSIRPPGSKSITNRALIAAALARGRSELRGSLFSGDTRVLAGALRALGIRVEADAAAKRFTIDGCAGRIPNASASLFVGNAGTAARFLPPMLALGSGRYRLDGTARMRERPIAPLVDALRSLGIDVTYGGADGAFPIAIGARGQVDGGPVEVDGSASSQFASGLMLSAPYYRRGLAIGLTGPPVSRPYLAATAAVMRAFGAEATGTAVEPGRYRARVYDVEPDASAASYFFAAAAIGGGRVRVEGLGRTSLQGDLGFARVLERMGCRVAITDSATEVEGAAEGLRGIDVDMRDLSDTAQTLAVVAPFASTPTRVTGIGFIRHKETDRIGAVVRELRRAGVDASEERDGYVIRPSRPHGARIETYDDHRMAMSFALLALRAGGIAIADPGCVAKTYPEFFRDLEQVAGITRL